MARKDHIFRSEQFAQRRFTLADALVHPGRSRGDLRGRAAGYGCAGRR